MNRIIAWFSRGAASKRDVQRSLDLRKDNPELELAYPLIEANLTKRDCFEILDAAGVERSEVYDLGYPNANCLGCFKSTSPAYWNLTRRLFPEVFERRAEQSRRLGVRMVEFQRNKVWHRIFLDELPPEMGRGQRIPSVSCGPHCSSGVQNVN